MGRRLSSVQTMLVLAERNSAGQTSSFRVKSAEALRIFINMTVNAGADTLQAYIEGSVDESTWYIIQAFDPLNAVLSATNSDKYTQAVISPPPYVRVRWTLSAAVTFGIMMSKAAQS